MYENFKRQTNEIVQEKIWTWLQKGNLKRETEGLLILFTNPSTRAGYDTRSVFKRSLTGLNLKFSFS